MKFPGPRVKLFSVRLACYGGYSGRVGNEQRIWRGKLSAGVEYSTVQCHSTFTCSNKVPLLTLTHGTSFRFLPDTVHHLRSWQFPLSSLCFPLWPHRYLNDRYRRKPTYFSPLPPDTPRLTKTMPLELVRPARSLHIADQRYESVIGICRVGLRSFHSFYFVGAISLSTPGFHFLPFGSSVQQSQFHSHTI